MLDVSLVGYFNVEFIMVMSKFNFIYIDFDDEFKFFILLLFLLDLWDINVFLVSSFYGLDILKYYEV